MSEKQRGTRQMGKRKMDDKQLVLNSWVEIKL
jgi:hypothetical protein